VSAGSLSKTTLASQVEEDLVLAEVAEVAVVVDVGDG
jgi:hypothetical protein